MIPILAEIGPVKLYSYGLMMALGFWLGAQIAGREHERRGGDADRFWKLALLSFVAALATSHLYWWGREALSGRAEIAELLSGSGHVWFAGMIGGLLTGWWLVRRFELDAFDVLDSAGMGLPLGHAIGRIGCHLAGDGDWGRVTEMPWGVAYERAIAGWPHPPGVAVHPTPLYETGAYTAVFLLLWGVRRRTPPGALLGASLVLTSIARFLIEFWRVTPVVGAGLTEAQWVAIGLTIVGAALLGRSRTLSGASPKTKPEARA